MLLKDKVAIIYGGSGAIGGATARVFAREGAKLVLVAQTVSRLDAIAQDAKRVGASVETAQVDVNDQEAIEKHAAVVADRHGGIDIVLNAFSIMHVQGTLFADLSLEAFMRPIEGFLRALFITSRAVAPHMGKRGSGVILTLSTPGSNMTTPGCLGYLTTCAAKEAFSRALANELAPRNIRVVCLRPHAISDAPAAGSYTEKVFAPMAAAAGLTVPQLLDVAAEGTMLKRLPTLSQVAETAAFLASDRAAAMTAAVANLTCGAVPD